MQHLAGLNLLLEDKLFCYHFNNIFICLGLFKNLR